MKIMRVSNKDLARKHKPQKDFESVFSSLGANPFHKNSFKNTIQQ